MLFLNHRIILSLRPILAKLSGDCVVPEVVLGNLYDFDVVTIGVQIRIAVYCLKTVMGEVVAVLDCIDRPKRTECRKLCLVGQICTALKLACEQAVFKGGLCTRVGRGERIIR